MVNGHGVSNNKFTIGILEIVKVTNKVKSGQTWIFMTLIIKLLEIEVAWFFR